ncbi:MAG: serine protease [Spirochaetaceae bacterium]|nr:serine protease [Spirochaetaceae bacterium]
MLNQANCSTNSDSLFSDQWHLENTGQTSGTSGEDANVSNLWNTGNCGTGVSIAIVSDGLDIDHEDLANNVERGKSHNYSNGGTDPGTAGTGLGTAMAGIIAAEPNNKGGRGVSPYAKLRGFNVSQNRSTTNDADAMIRGLSEVSVYANGWSEPEFSGKFQDSTSEWRSAIDSGLSLGRNGLGALYFFGSGDGDTVSSFSGIDNSNLNGYTNYHGVMAICGVGHDGVRASFSEQGANLLVCGHSKGNGDIGIRTTDTTGAGGYNNGSSGSDYSDSNYTKLATGTGTAVAEVAGVTAMMLYANPNLSWRDVRMILARTARKNNSGDSDWTTNGAGLNINHKYGFGVVDANAAVNLARNWISLATQKTFQTSTSTVSATVTDGNATGVTNSIVVSGSGISTIESVDVNVTFSHNYYRDLDITLTSPSGTQSILLSRGSDGICVNIAVASPTIEANGNCPFTGTWRFGVLRTMGESADGTWSLRLRDQGVRGTANGTFTSWSMKLYGY